MLARDLADFIMRWKDFRDDATALRIEIADERQRDVLQWLIELADRVGPRDIGDVTSPRKGEA